MVPTADHISVCICTYKRPNYLDRLLRALKDQTTEQLFTYSIVVVDNDHTQSAIRTVETAQKTSLTSIDYYHEPEQNIALARNRAIANAKGNFVAFIDDDEFPVGNWLLSLYKAHKRFKADGILGPVLPHYEVAPPKWIVRGKFYERTSHRTGEVLDWTNTRTGNVLLSRDIFIRKENLFRQEFGSGGEDKDFFRRMVAIGFRFVWSAEAPVYESVTPERYKRSFMLKRALLRGKAPHFGHFDIVKSLVAISLYSSALPVLFLLGHHRFMKYLIKDFDHIGRVLAFLGLNIIKQKYVMN